MCFCGVVCLLCWWLDCVVRFVCIVECVFGWLLWLCVGWLVLVFLFVRVLVGLGCLVCACCWLVGWLVGWCVCVFVCCCPPGLCVVVVILLVEMMCGLLFCLLVGWLWLAGWLVGALVC